MRYARRSVTILLAITSAALLLSCHSNVVTAPTFPNIAGAWQGDVTSPTAPGCNASLNVTITQTGATFTGSFAIPGVQGTLQGLIDPDGTIWGSIDEQVVAGPGAGCTGHGDFTGTATGTAITVSVPTVSSSNPACRFCQLNVIRLHR